MDGKGAGRFGPEETVNRAQMATFILNAYEFVSGQTLTASSNDSADDEGHVFARFTNASAEAGFTVGRDGGDEPAGVVLRDQMAAFLARTLDLLVDEVRPPRTRDEQGHDPRTAAEAGTLGCRPPLRAADQTRERFLLVTML